MGGKVLAHQQRLQRNQTKKPSQWIRASRRNKDPRSSRWGHRLRTFECRGQDAEMDHILIPTTSTHTETQGCKLNKGVKRRSHDQQTGSFVIWRSSLAIGRLGVGSEQSDFRCKRISDLGVGDPAQITPAKVLSPSIALNIPPRDNLFWLCWFPSWKRAMQVARGLLLENVVHQPMSTQNWTQHSEPGNETPPEGIQGSGPLASLSKSIRVSSLQKVSHDSYRPTVCIPRAVMHTWGTNIE